MPPFSAHFTTEELEDSATGHIKLEEGFIEKLEELRVQYAKPMVITSGCRTAEHNEWLIRRGFKASKNSLHLIDNKTYGTDTCAVDIARPNGPDAHRLVRLATVAGWTIGWAQTFIHLDRRVDYTALPATIYDYFSRREIVEKKWYQSKTLWANIVAGVATVSTAFGLDLGLDAETQVAFVGGIMAVVNIVLRIVTKGPVTR
jgi:hypothetical protein